MAKSVNGKMWSFRKISENENALEAGGEHQHRLQLQRAHDKELIQVTTNSTNLGQRHSGSTLSGFKS